MLFVKNLLLQPRILTAERSGNIAGKGKAENAYYKAEYLLGIHFISEESIAVILNVFNNRTSCKCCKKSRNAAHTVAYTYNTCTLFTGNVAEGYVYKPAVYACK